MAYNIYYKIIATLNGSRAKETQIDSWVTTTTTEDLGLIQRVISPDHVATKVETTAAALARVSSAYGSPVVEAAGTKDVEMAEATQYVLSDPPPSLDNMSALSFNAGMLKEIVGGSDRGTFSLGCYTRKSPPRSMVSITLVSIRREYMGELEGNPKGLSSFIASS
ncbi:hypothetical protein K501DRAFT_267443 [Backusella circina FSU 941]|nr:hypothetical protein K501DRAFT_267443 [Backusella circina FSU 941]